MEPGKGYLSLKGSADMGGRFYLPLPPPQLGEVICRRYFEWEPTEEEQAEK